MICILVFYLKFEILCEDKNIHHFYISFHFDELKYLFKNMFVLLSRSINKQFGGCFENMNIHIIKLIRDGDCPFVENSPMIREINKL